METKYLKINPADNVVVAISDLKQAGHHGRQSCHHVEGRRACRP